MKQLILPPRIVAQISAVYLIAEIPANHGGSLSKALAEIKYGLFSAKGNR